VIGFPRRAARVVRSPRFAPARFIVAAFLLWRAVLFLGEHFVPEVLPGAALDHERVARVGYERTNLSLTPEERARAKTRGLARDPSTPYPAGVPFPMLPYLSRGLSALTGMNITLAGVVLSHMALLGALFFVFALARRYFDEGGARRAVLFVLVVPTSLFFIAYSPAALFLFFASGALLAYQGDRLRDAGLFGAGAALTLPIGSLLFPAFLLAALLRGRATGRMWQRRLCWLALIPLAAAIFAVVFHHVTNNALAFVMWAST